MHPFPLETAVPGAEPPYHRIQDGSVTISRRLYRTSPSHVIPPSGCGEVIADTSTLNGGPLCCVGWTVSDGIDGQRLAIQFQARVTSDMCEVQFVLAHAAGPNSYILEVYDDQEGLPGGAPIELPFAAANIFGESENFQTVPLTKPIERGRKYWVGIRSNGGGATWGALNFNAALDCPTHRLALDNGSGFLRFNGLNEGNWMIWAAPGEEPSGLTFDTAYGGGGTDERVTETGVWTFDVLSSDQRDAALNCGSSVMRPFGSVPSQYGWVESADSTSPPIHLNLEQGWFDTPSHDVGGGVLAFFDLESESIDECQLSLVESPVLDSALFEGRTGLLEIRFSGNSNDLPSRVVLVTGSRVSANGLWSDWSDVEAAIATGPSDYAILLPHKISDATDAVQIRVGIRNGPQSVPNRGPVIDDVRLVLMSVSGKVAADLKTIPDIAQDDEPVCTAAAYSNCLMWWSQNGYPEIAPPGNTPKERNDAMLATMIKKFYGDKDGNEYKGGKSDFGIVEFLREKGVSNKTNAPLPDGRAPLKVQAATEKGASWTYLTEHVAQKHDVVLLVEYLDAKGDTVMDESGKPAQHGLTVAGVSTDSKGNPQIVVANPWGRSHDVVASDEDAKAAYETLKVSVNADGTVRIDDDELETRAKGVKGADHLKIKGIRVVMPAAPASTPKVDTDVTPNLPPGKNQYAYTIDNLDNYPLDFFAIITNGPPTDITTPLGWTWELLPAQRPSSDTCEGVIGPQGVAWRTASNAIPPRGNLAGFGFSVSSMYPAVDSAAVGCVASGTDVEFGVIADGPGPATGLNLFKTAGGCPGSIAFQVSNATPDESVALIFSATTGSFVIPSGSICAGTSLGLGNASLQLVQVNTADSTGGSAFSGIAPNAACGRFLQALDTHTCRTSNVIQIN